MEITKNAYYYNKGKFNVRVASLHILRSEEIVGYSKIPFFCLHASLQFIKRRFASVSARMWSMVTNVNVHWDGLGQTVISTSTIVHPTPA